MARSRSVKPKVSKVTKTETKVSAGTASSVAGKRNRKAKRNYTSYSHFLLKVLKDVHPDATISRKAMDIMNSFVNDIFERVAREASRLAKYSKLSTIGSREIFTAVRLLLPDELGKHAISEGTKAVTRYSSSKRSESPTIRVKRPNN